MYGYTRGQEENYINDFVLVDHLYQSLNATILRVANRSLIRHPWSIPTARSFVAHFPEHQLPILCKWARVVVWLDADLEIATKKAFLSTVEAIHESIEILGTRDCNTGKPVIPVNWLKYPLKYTGLPKEKYRYFR
jgi:hypothetical protein